MSINLQDFIGGRYLQKEDVPEPTIVTIKDVVPTQFEGEGRKLVIHFEEFEKGMVANKTNLRLAAGLFESRDVEKWKGRKLTLYNDLEIMFQGRCTGGLRLRAAPADDGETPF